MTEDEGYTPTCHQENCNLRTSIPRVPEEIQNKTKRSPLLQDRSGRLTSPPGWVCKVKSLLEQKRTGPASTKRDEEGKTNYKETTRPKCLRHSFKVQKENSLGEGVGEGSTSALPKGGGKEESLARAMCPTGMSSRQAVSMGPRRAAGAWAWQWGDKWGK